VIRQRAQLLTTDAGILFVARTVRSFGYGFLSVVLVLYLAALGLDDVRIGLILGLTLLGDAGISLLLTTRADSLGRRRVLILGSALIVTAGVLLVASSDFWVLVIAGTIGVVSVSGGEVGPFEAVEQASLSQIVADRLRTRVFGWYQLVGSMAAAFGALVAGLAVSATVAAGGSTLDGYRFVLLAYAAIGVALAIIFAFLSPRIEAVRRSEPLAARFGLHRSQRTVVHLSGLFAIDAFGSSLIGQGLQVYWLNVHFGAQPDQLGAIFFVANFLSGLSALMAARLAPRIGLVRTMVATQVPSCILLLLLPFMPTLELAALIVFVRASVARMDIPARQSYIVAVVDPDERSAAAGVTGIVRTLSSVPGPLLATPLLAASGGLSAVPFLLGGGLKLLYNGWLYRDFRGLRPPEERRLEASAAVVPDPEIELPAGS
jgi:MFS family permease